MENTTRSLWQIFKLYLEKFACHHKWIIHHECSVYNNTGKIRIGFEHTVVCTECGKFKTLMM